MSDVTLTGPDLTAPRARGRRRIHPLAWFVLRRLAIGLVTLVVASIVIFLGTSVIPGSPATAVLGRQASPQAIAAIDHRIGYDKPLLERYAIWLKNAVQGNLGNSTVAEVQGSKAPNWPLIRGPFANTVVLALSAVIFLIPLSLLFGLIAGLHAGKWPDHLISTLTMVFMALPEFVVGSLLIVIFSVWLDVLPPVSLLAPGSSPLRPSEYPRPTGAHAPGGLGGLDDPARARRDDRGPADGLRPNGAPPGDLRAQGTPALRAAELTRAKRADLRAVDPVSVRRRDRHRDRCSTSRRPASTSSRRRACSEEIKRLHTERGLAMVYVSHDLSVISQIADRIVVLYAGRVVEEGPVAQVPGLRPRHPYTRGLVASIPDHTARFAVHGIPGVAVGLDNRPQGCAFAPRCPQVVDRCHSELPPLEDQGDGLLRRFESRRTPPLERSEGLAARDAQGEPLLVSSPI